MFSTEYLKGIKQVFVKCTQVEMTKGLHEVSGAEILFSSDGSYTVYSLSLVLSDVGKAPFRIEREVLYGENHGFNRTCFEALDAVIDEAVDCYYNDTPMEVCCNPDIPRVKLEMPEVYSFQEIYDYAHKPCKMFLESGQDTVSEDEKKDDSKDEKLSEIDKVDLIFYG